ncbi:MAG: NAD(P)-dependent oxidoreductase [Anaerovoracaceae bacterium]
MCSVNGDGSVKKLTWRSSKRKDIHRGAHGKEIAGCTVGVVGTGNIGRLTAEKFIALGRK